MKANNLDEIDRQIIRTMADCNMRVSAVARRLDFHRNSIVYHIERIKGETGLDPMRFYDLVQLIKEMEEQE